MISGALFLSKKEINIKKLYTKNIVRIIISLAFWNLLYAIYLNPEIFQSFSMHNIGKILNHFNGYHYHLAFLLSLLGLYIISPILKKVAEDKQLLKYTLIITIIFAIGVPSINSLVSIFINLFGQTKYLIIFYNLTNWLFRINIPFVAGYFIYFILGYYLYSNEIKHKKTLYIIGAGATLYTILSTQIFSNILNTPVANFYDYNSFNVMLSASAIFIFFKDIVSKIKISKLSGKIITTISNCSFGIYLIHEFFNMYFIRIGFISTLFNPLLSIPVITLVIFILSFVIIYIISKIPVLNKYII